MKRLIYNTVETVVKFVQKAGAKQSLHLYKRIREFIYSLWYSSLFSSPEVKFEYPVAGSVGWDCFHIGKGTRFGRYAAIAAHKNYRGETFNPNVVIGENCNFGSFLNLTCINSITIGDNLLTGRWVTITDNSHGLTTEAALTLPPLDRGLISKGEVRIGKNVWIGDKVTILPGVHIGDGAVIGSNSVVTADIPPYTVAVGVPAKIIRQH